MSDGELVVFAAAIGLGAYLIANIIKSWRSEVKYQRDWAAVNERWRNSLKEGAVGGLTRG